MPYINKTRRLYTDPVVDSKFDRASDPGELNFQITTLVLDYLADKQLNYYNYNNVIGALECCKLEFYRRAMAPYEDIKIEENGDVF